MKHTKGELKIIKLTKGNYQRNGVCGVPFYSVMVDWKETGNRTKYSSFLITFEATNDNKIIHSSCRVVDINYPDLCWRGDNFGVALSQFFQTKGITDLYEYIGCINKAKGV